MTAPAPTWHIRGIRQNITPHLAQTFSNALEGFRLPVGDVGNHLQLPLDIPDRRDQIEVRRLQQRHMVRDRFQRFVRCLRRLVAFRRFDHVVDEGLAMGQAWRDLHGAQGRDKFFIGHLDTPRVARALTRYVAGTLLASLRQLQRKAWVRRAAATRPSDTTGAGA